MFPYLTVGTRQIPLYGCFAALGIMASLLYTRRYEKTNGEYGADIDLALVYGLIGGVVGAKVLYLLINMEELISEFHLLFSDTNTYFEKYLSGGFVYFGGLFGFLAAIHLYAKIVRIPSDEIISPAVPAFALFHALGRVGCFFAGCCYGKPTKSIFGVVNHNSEIAPNEISLIPVQLFESAVEIVIFFVLLSLQKKHTSGRKIQNHYLLLYGVARFFLEFLRGDTDRGFIGLLSVSQIIALVVSLYAVGSLSIDKAKQHKAAPRRKR